MKTAFKVSVLMVLVFASFYQTTRLWFDYPSNYNFFYSLTTDGDVLASNQEPNYNLFFPKTLAVYTGVEDGDYKLLTLSQSDSVNIIDDSLNLIKDAFQVGQAQETTMEEERIWQKPHLLFILPYTLTDDILERDYSVPESWFPEDYGFDRFYIISQGDAVKVVFSDSTLSHMITLLVNEEQVTLFNEGMAEWMEAVSQMTLPTYNSTKQAGYGYFEHDVLLPVGSQSFDLRQRVPSVLSFMQGGRLDIDAFTAFTKSFFRSPESIWSTTYDNEIRVGDMQAVIHYDGTGLFDYRLIAELDASPTTVEEGLTLADEFLSADRLLKDIEYGLADFDVAEDGIHYYYDYEYRNVPVLFESMDDQMSYPMEIIVKDKTVVEYRRYLWSSQDVVTQGAPFDVQFQKPLDELLQIDSLQPLLIQDMQLSYKVDDMSGQAILNWVVTIDKERYFIELE